MVDAERLEQLTGLRFLAALGVSLRHLYVLALYLGAKFLFFLGGHGVTLFFVLSVFVLALRYNSPNQGGSRQAPDFPLGWTMHWLGAESTAPLAGVLVGILSLIKLSVLLHQWLRRRCV